MIILALLFLLDLLSDVKRPFYQSEHPIAIGNEKVSERKKQSITIYGNGIFLVGVKKIKTI